jgi:hypothetical protein
MWEPRRLTALRASTTCYRDSSIFFFVGSIGLTISLLTIKQCKTFKYFKVTFMEGKMKEKTYDSYLYYARICI